MIPAMIMSLDKLPLTPNGKLDRQSLPAPAGKRSGLLRTYLPPGNITEFQIIQLWENILNIKPIGITDNFFDLGGHSMLAFRVLAELKNLFKKEVPLTTLFRRPTVQQLAEIYYSGGEPIDESHLVVLQPLGSNKPFFCVHPISGAPFSYLLLAHHLGTDQPFYALQAIYPKDQYTTFEEMAARYIKDIRDVQPKGPYRLGGWSFGGIIAFEMAQQLVRQGEEVSLLALFDSSAPGRHTKPLKIDALSLDNPRALALIAREVARNTLRELPLDIDELARRKPEERIQYILDQAKKEDILTYGMTPELVLRLLKSYRGRMIADLTYTPSVYPGRITFFEASEALYDMGDYKELCELVEIPDDCNQMVPQAPIWANLSQQPIEHLVVLGSHLTLMSEPYVEVLAQQLKNFL
jgi:thioesterase domain-containing protein/acyl carrier protein